MLNSFLVNVLQISGKEGRNTCADITFEAMFKLLFQLFMLYLLYKLIFNFIIPVYRTTKQMKSKMQDMQEHIQRQQQQGPAASAESPKKSVPADDYIEFEEVR